MARSDFETAEMSRRLDLVAMDGVIASFILKPLRVRVAIEDGLVTDDLPCFGPFGGRFRGWAPPKIGEPVLVLCPTGEPTQGRVLRGLDSDLFFHPGELESLAVLLWDSEGQFTLDSYDAATKTRTVRVPPGGVVVLQLEGGPEVRLEGTTATVKAAEVLLGPDGGVRKPIARHGDAVVSGAIVASSSAVKSS